MGRRPARLLIVIVLLGVQLGLPATPAHAVVCTSEKHIFIRQSSTSLRWGVRGKINVPNNIIDSCSDGSTFTTIHFTNCQNQCATQVEIGIKDKASGPVLFTEKKLSGEILKYDQITTAPNNTLVSLRLKVTQGGDVFFEYDFGSGWVTTWSSPYNISWAPGYPMGETEKRGDDTQMFSHHRDMKYLQSGWTEGAWLGMTCVKDEAPGWSWSPLSGSTNDWDVVNTRGGTCVPV